MTFGERLRELRGARGLTQEQMAEEIGVNKYVLVKWENDYIAKPQARTLSKLSDFFGVSIEYLMGSEEPAPTPNYIQILSWS